MEGNKYSFRTPEQVDGFAQGYNKNRNEPVDSELTRIVERRGYSEWRINHVVEIYGLVKKWLDTGYPDWCLDYEKKKDLYEYCVGKMNDLKDKLYESPDNLGEYLGYIWGAIVAADSTHIEEYSDEELVVLSPEDRAEYLRMIE